MSKRMNWILALTLLSFITAGFFLTVAPDRIPAHYDIHGTVDRYGSKYEFLIYPACTLLQAVSLAAVARYEERKGRKDNRAVVEYLCIWSLVLENLLWVFLMWQQVRGAAL